MLDNALSQFSALAILILRLSIGVIFIVHGWAKVDPRGQMGGVRALWRENRGGPSPRAAQLGAVRPLRPNVLDSRGQQVRSDRCH